MARPDRDEPLHGVRRVGADRGSHGLPHERPRPHGDDRRADPLGDRCCRSSTTRAAASSTTRARARLRGDGARAEHHRRLRRPARPRLRRLLRARRLTAGWLVSGFVVNAGEGEGFSLFVGEPASMLPGIHLNFLLVIIVAVIVTTIAGMLIGLPTLRLRGDYIAIVTLAFGEIIGRDRHQRRRDHDRRPEAHERAPGHHAGRQDRPAVPRTVHIARPETVVLRRARAGVRRAVRELPAARLAPRARLDRAARGRGRGRLDGRPARQDEAARLRHRRGVRRLRRRLPRRPT